MPFTRVESSGTWLGCVSVDVPDAQAVRAWSSGA